MSGVEIDPPYEVRYVDGHVEVFIPIRVTNVAGIIDTTVVNADTARELANEIISALSEEPTRIPSDSRSDRG